MARPDGHAPTRSPPPADAALRSFGSCSFDEPVQRPRSAGTACRVMSRPTTIRSLRSFVDVRPRVAFSDPEPALRRVSAARPAAAARRRRHRRIRPRSGGAGTPRPARRSRRWPRRAALRSLVAQRLHGPGPHGLDAVREHDQSAAAARRAATTRRCTLCGAKPWCRWPTSRCCCRSRSATTPISTRRASTPRTSARCSAARTTRCMPNWLHLPVAYHGRASSVVVSGTDLHRPLRADEGRRRRRTRRSARAGPSISSWRWASSSARATRSASRSRSTQAAEHMFGMVLVNDWSARDIQKWEYVPLGPFLAKNFGTSISPWVVTLDALEPFRVAGPPQDPPPLPYLQTDGRLGLRHSTGSRAADRGDGEPHAHLPLELRAPVLELLPAGGPSHGQRLQPAARRPAGLRHHQRADARFARLPAGTDLEGHASRSRLPGGETRRVSRKTATASR